MGYLEMRELQDNETRITTLEHKVAKLIDKHANLLLLMVEMVEVLKIKINNLR